MPVNPSPVDVSTQAVQIARKVVDLEAGVQRVTNAISNDMTQLSRAVQDLSAKMANVLTRLGAVEKSLTAALRGMDVGYGPGQVSPAVPGYTRDVGVPTYALRPEAVDLVGRDGAAQVNPIVPATGAPPAVQRAEQALSWYSGMEEEQDAELG